MISSLLMICPTILIKVNDMDREEYWKKNHEEATKIIEKQQAEIDKIMNVLEIALLGCVTVAEYKKIIETLVEANKGE